MNTLATARLAFYGLNFLDNQGYITLAITTRSEFCDLHAHALPIFLICCMLQTIILKTIGEIAEKRTLLIQVYRAKLLKI